MSTTYNIIGSLSSLKKHLEENGLHEFKSVKDIIDFRDSYKNNRQNIIANHAVKIEQEEVTLKKEIKLLSDKIAQEKLSKETEIARYIILFKNKIISLKNSSSNIFNKTIVAIKEWYYKAKIKRAKHKHNRKHQKAISKLEKQLQNIEDRYCFIQAKRNDAINESANEDLITLKRKVDIIHEANSLIYGAIGENKVAKELQKLPDEYHLINDFNLKFNPALYYYKDKSHIKTVQIDHVLVGPQGIFLIETKNWSKRSLENSNLRSPVQQSQRAGYAIFKLLNDINKSIISLKKHHWGSKKIPVRNLIVFIKNKPKEEFQFVKTLTLDELNQYISFFKPVLTNEDVSNIAKRLVSISR